MSNENGLLPCTPEAAAHEARIAAYYAKKPVQLAYTVIAPKKAK
jgi:hypothetical protein